MIKAKFIGESDNFFKNGEVYEILSSHIDWFGPFRDINVKFRPVEQKCPFCHRPIGIIDYIFADRTIPYKDLESFLENWEVIYE